MQSEQEKEKDPDVLVVRLARKTKKVKIYTDEEGTECRNCTIKEMVGTHRDDWENEKLKRYKIDANGVRVGYDLKDLRANLIAKCLFNENGELFEIKEIKNWASTAQDALYDECIKINALSQEASDEAKKV